MRHFFGDAVLDFIRRRLTFVTSALATGVVGDELVARGLTANALALKLRVPANRITDIVRGRRALTAETALRLGRYFGTRAKFWVDLQASYDLAVAERDFGAVIQQEIDPA